jgi:cytochrome c553
MRELGMALLGTLAIAVFFGFKVYPELEYTGGTGGHSCTGECYVEYVKQYGTPSEIEQRKQALANLDEFSDIRSLWAGCAACHGQAGEGMAVFPKLAGQSSDYIVDRLNTYKNRGQVGAMSSTMWAQAGMLSSDQMEQIGKFIEAGLPGK